MGDLVERLQRLGKDSVGNYGMPIAAEAANEIESLRSALAKSASREAALVEKLKVAESGLQFYADGNHFDYKDSDHGAYACEFGTTAAEALAKIKEAS